MKKLKSVLLIDDDEVTNYINTLILKKAGCFQEIHAYRDGRAALNFLSELIEKRKQLPEILLLDVNMPKMSGWEFMEEYDQLDRDYLQHTMVIMLSMSLNPDDQLKLVEYDLVKGFKNKPLSEETVHGLVEEYLLNKESHQSWCR